MTTSHPTTWRGGNLFQVMSSWAVLKSSFISQGRKELLTPPLTRHLRGHIASLHNGIPVFCLRRLTLLRVLLTHTFLWPPPILPHERGLLRGSVDFQATVWEYCFAMCRNENVNLSTGLIHQTAKTVWLCQHKMHCHCANNLPDTTSSLEAGHQHNLVQRHGLNLRCVQKTNWWHGRSSCATPWEMRGNRWIVKGPFIRVVAVLCAIGGQRGIKT